jgi:prophage antirepressor-like protein
MVEIKRIPETEYVYAIIDKNKNNTWKMHDNKTNKPYDRTYKPAKLLVSVSWVKRHVPLLKDPSVRDEGHEEEASHEAEHAPLISAPVFTLRDEEKFHAPNGTVLDIEVRGERHPKMCYFKVSDVSHHFGIPALRKVITDDRTSYVSGRDYVYCLRFPNNDGVDDASIRPHVVNHGITANKDGVDDESIRAHADIYGMKPNKNGVRDTNGEETSVQRRMLFLTYEGLLKTLYTTRSPIAQSFREWATERLFVMHLGTPAQKSELAGQLLGVDVRTLQDVFQRSTDKTPCIYLCVVSEGRALRSRVRTSVSSTLGDDDIVCKYGFTDDLPRRMKEHAAHFEKQKGLGPVSLLCFSIIDPRFLSDAEGNLKRFFRHSSVTYEQYTELVCIKPNEVKEMKKQFHLIQRSCGVKDSDLMERIRVLEADMSMAEERHKRKMLEKDLSYHEQKSRGDLLEKDVEVYKAEVENERLRRRLVEHGIAL